MLFNLNLVDAISIPEHSFKISGISLLKMGMNCIEFHPWARCQFVDIEKRMNILEQQIIPQKELSNFIFHIHTPS